MLAFSILVALSAPSTNYLAVDGLLIGRLEGRVWRSVAGVQPIKRTICSGMMVSRFASVGR